MKNSKIFVSLLTGNLYMNKVSYPGVVELNYTRTITNDAYDPSKANNGGGYLWTDTFIETNVYGQQMTIQIFDTSCGDFGARFDVVVAYGNTEKRIDFNEMDEICWIELDFNNKLDLAAKMILEAIGYYPPV